MTKKNKKNYWFGLVLTFDPLRKLKISFLFLPLSHFYFTHAMHEVNWKYFCFVCYPKMHAERKEWIKQIRAFLIADRVHCTKNEARFSVLSQILMITGFASLTSFDSQITNKEIWEKECILSTKIKHEKWKRKIMSALALLIEYQ